MRINIDFFAQCKYSLVACCAKSKRLGIGLAERSWANVKKIKDGKQSILGGAGLDKRALLFTSAKLWESNVTPNAKNSDNTNFFGVDDIKWILFNLNFE